jgi:acylphosphatase
MAQSDEQETNRGHLSRRYVVSGRVQGVGFRYFVQRHAQQLGISGWVRNLATGSVEVEGAGTAEQLEGFEELLWRGPRFSNVTNVDKTEIPVEPSGPIGFHIID